MNTKTYLLNSELIVHAGGLSERWFEVTQGKLTKPITCIGKNPRPVIDWIILPWVKAGIKKIFVSIWHNPNELIEHLNQIGKNTGIEFVFLREPQDKRLGRAGVIKHYLENGILSEDKPKISINSSDLMKLNIDDLVQFHLEGFEKGFLATIVCSISEASQFGRVVYHPETYTVMNFVEKPVVQLPKGEHINTGLFYLDSKLNKLFSEIEDSDLPVDLEKSKILSKICPVMRSLGNVVPFESWLWLKNLHDYNKVKDLDLEKWFEITPIDKYLGPFSLNDKLF
jgi:NDP-sugar pyrophosphorylase family protein